MAPSRASDQAGEVFTEVFTQHVRRIEQRMPAAIADEPDGIHRLRTAVRRLRTVLSVYRPVFDRAEVDALRERLAVLGDVLGEARDLEVRRGDVESLGRSARVSLAARSRLVAELDAEHVVAHGRVVRWCSGPGWDELSAELLRWVAAPPLGKAAEKKARTVARKRLKKATGKALRAADDIDLSRLDSTHELRKAGRRLTHAARAVTSKPTKVLGSSARELGAAGKQIQSTLGDHRDMVLLARHVTAVGGTVVAEAGDRAPYDRLARAAERRGHDALEEATVALEALREATR